MCVCVDLLPEMPESRRSAWIGMMPIRCSTTFVQMETPRKAVCSNMMTRTKTKLCKPVTHPLHVAPDPNEVGHMSAVTKVIAAVVGWLQLVGEALPRSFQKRRFIISYTIGTRRRHPVASKDIIIVIRRLLHFICRLVSSSENTKTGVRT